MGNDTSAPKKLFEQLDKTKDGVLTLDDLLNGNFAQSPLLLFRVCPPPSNRCRRVGRVLVVFFFFFFFMLEQQARAPRFMSLFTQKRLSRGWRGTTVR